MLASAESSAAGVASVRWAYGMRALLITLNFSTWNCEPLDLAAGDVLELLFPSLFRVADKEQGQPVYGLTMLSVCRRTLHLQGACQMREMRISLSL